MTRKTKIIATLGPATETADGIRSLIRAGVNVFRLNMSHARHDWVRTVVDRVRAESTSAGRRVAVLIDLQGPSIRTGDLPEKLSIVPGDEVEFRNAGLPAGLALSTETNYTGLADDVSVGDTLLVDNGVLHFEIIRRETGRLIGRALTEGAMGSRRHINLPGVRVNLPSLTDKDRADIALAAAVDADYVAISFVRDAAHIGDLREELARHGSAARIVAKIEDQEAVKHLRGIVEAADAVMVARGDLGIEVHVEELPVVQRAIVSECARVGRKVIVATHMLESMIGNPVPTRAEVTDVANAIYEQADAVMLSGETSVGEYPVKCVEMLDRIARRMEREPGARFCDQIELPTEKHRTVKAAVVLADSLPGSKIVVFTARGVLADYLTHQRPVHSPIHAFCPDERVCRALSLNRAVTGHLMTFSERPEETIHRAVEILRQRGDVAAGDAIVVLSDVLTGAFDTEAILLRKA